MHPNTVKLLKRLLALVLGGCVCFTIAFFVYLNSFSPEAREAKRFLKAMPVDQILAVELEPVPNNPNPLAHRLISVKDREQLATIASLIQSAERDHPKHPHQRWAMILRFRLKDRIFSGQLVSTSNQGVLFYYGYEIGGGANYGTYRQDALGPIIEAIVAHSTHH
jgi:hypothetical protein